MSRWGLRTQATMLVCSDYPLISNWVAVYNSPKVVFQVMPSLGQIQSSFTYSQIRGCTIFDSRLFHSYRGFVIVISLLFGETF